MDSDAHAFIVKDTIGELVVDAREFGQRSSTKFGVGTVRTTFGAAVAIHCATGEAELLDAFRVCRVALAVLHAVDFSATLCAARVSAKVGVLPAVHRAFLSLAVVSTRLAWPVCAFRSGVPSAVFDTGTLADGDTVEATELVAFYLMVDAVG